MLCRKPYINAAGQVFGCGQCLPCRINKRRVWMHRIMLEAAQFADNAFVTLTYDDEHLPPDGSLVPGDMQAFLKRLRSRVAPIKFRFYAVGEYGDETWRPHYHAALFNFGTCAYGRSRYSKLYERCCVRCELVRDAWGKGNIFLGTVEDGSAEYMAKYVVKKMTADDDPRLQGRRPEFARMSLKPGIAGDCVWEIADALMRYELEEVLDDVPNGLRSTRKVLPLGRYVKRRLREAVGRDASAPQSVYDKINAEMLPLRLAARSDKDDPSLRSKVAERDEGRLRQVENRFRLFGKRGSL